MQGRASGDAERERQGDVAVPTTDGETMAQRGGGRSHSEISSLSLDYAEITGLMARMDQQIGSFVDNMSKLNDSAPQHAGLAGLWDEQTKSIRQELLETDDPTSSVQATKSKSKQKAGAARQQPGNLDDKGSDAEEGADNKSDPLVFL